VRLGDSAQRDRLHELRRPWSAAPRRAGGGTRSAVGFSSSASGAESSRRPSTVAGITFTRWRV
jgi:hypothetical protein